MAIPSHTWWSLELWLLCCVQRLPDSMHVLRLANVAAPKPNKIKHISIAQLCLMQALNKKFGCTRDVWLAFHVNKNFLWPRSDSICCCISKSIFLTVTPAVLVWKLWAGFCVIPRLWDIVRCQRPGGGMIAKCTLRCLSLFFRRVMMANDRKR